MSETSEERKVELAVSSRWWKCPHGHVHVALLDEEDVEFAEMALNREMIQGFMDCLDGKPVPPAFRPADVFQ